MPLKVTHEDSDFADMPAERCCMCRAPTRYWYTLKNVALCQLCAKVTAVKDVPSNADWCAKEHKLNQRVYEST